MSSEIDIEVVPGLPGDLPAGESVVWQGRPQWSALARNTFKMRWLTAYFGIFLAARFALAVQERQGLTGVLHVIGLAALAGTCLGVLALLAWVNARSTTYTITTRRIVMRVGVALPMTWNLPFKRLAAADMKVRKEGDGDIELQLVAPDRIAWMQLWPHTAPGHLMRARPTLRAIAEPSRVARLLAEAVQVWAKAEAAPVLVASPEAVVPSTPAHISEPVALRTRPAPHASH